MAGSKSVKLSTFSGFFTAKFAKYPAPNECPTKWAFLIQSFSIASASQSESSPFSKGTFCTDFQTSHKVSIEKTVWFFVKYSKFSDHIGVPEL